MTTTPDKRRVLVTGGGTGIGLAVAKAFSTEGDAVTIAGRREAALVEAVKDTSIEYRVTDVTAEADIDALFEKPFDVVIANAGTATAAKITSLSLEDWNNTLAVNLTGTFLTFRAALRAMDKAELKNGRLIAIASIASLQGSAPIPAYTASKHGVLGLVRSVAQDVAKRGTTCNAICPGYVDTEMAQGGIDALMKRFDISKEQATEKLVGGNPMGRLINPEEVAATALFLASEGAASINGHALSVSGGEI